MQPKTVWSMISLQYQFVSWTNVELGWAYDRAKPCLPWEREWQDMSSFSILFRILSEIRLNVKLLKRANRFSKREVERERERERWLRDGHEKRRLGKNKKHVQTKLYLNVSMFTITSNLKSMPSLQLFHVRILSLTNPFKTLWYRELFVYGNQFTGFEWQTT